MNALRINSEFAVISEIDRLIADHGARKVFTAVLIRFFRRSRPPDAEVKRSRVRLIVPAYLRDDLGLPPEPVPRAHVDLSRLRSEFYW